MSFEVLRLLRRSAPNIGAELLAMTEMWWVKNPPYKNIKVFNHGNDDNGKDFGGSLWPTAD